MINDERQFNEAGLHIRCVPDYARDSVKVDIAILARGRSFVRLQYERLSPDWHQNSEHSKYDLLISLQEQITNQLAVLALEA